MLDSNLKIIYFLDMKNLIKFTLYYLLKLTQNHMVSTRQNSGIIPNVPLVLFFTQLEFYFCKLHNKDKH